MTLEEALRFIDPETLRPTWSDPDKDPQKEVKECLK